MKVMLLASASSIHSVRWANALSAEGIEIVLITQHDQLAELKPQIRVLKLPFSGSIGYFRNASAVRQLLRAERPDLLHAHYASGYGTTARLSRFNPTLLSVWGSDVYEFPTRSPLHRWWLRGNVLAATHVASTSHAMAAELRKIAPELRDVSITPFGVETHRFKSVSSDRRSPDAPIVIGTVKTLEPHYGIDVLIDSVAILVNARLQKQPDVATRIRLRIVGEGSQREALQRRALTRGIGAITEFHGRVPHGSVPDELSKLDVYVALSRQESFGVAVIEAGACGLPVVVSDAGGLPEVVADGESGFVVPRENPTAAAAALHRLVLDADLRHHMGFAGRQRIVSQYDWQDNVRGMINIYERLTSR